MQKPVIYSKIIDFNQETQFVKQLDPVDMGDYIFVGLQVETASGALELPDNATDDQKLMYQVEQLKKECEQKIMSGFASSAYQGVEKVYSSSLENQATISSLFMVALSNLSGVTEEPIEHKAISEIQCYEWTEQEIIQLGKDLKNHITLCKKECEAKILELMSNA